MLDVKPPTLQMELRDERMEYQSAAHPRVKYLSDLSKEEQDLILFYRQLKDKKSAFQHLQALYEKEQALHKQEEEDFLAALGERLRKKPED